MDDLEFVRGHSPNCPLRLTVAEDACALERIWRCRVSFRATFTSAINGTGEVVYDAFKDILRSGVAPARYL
jgi:hypothetical protein